MATKLEAGGYKVLITGPLKIRTFLRLPLYVYIFCMKPQVQCCDHFYARKNENGLFDLCKAFDYINNAIDC